MFFLWAGKHFKPLYKKFDQPCVQGGCHGCLRRALRGSRMLLTSVVLQGPSKPVSATAAVTRRFGIFPLLVWDWDTFLNQHFSYFLNILENPLFVWCGRFCDQVVHLTDWLRHIAPNQFTLILLQRVTQSSSARDILLAYILLCTGLRPSDKLPSYLVLYYGRVNPNGCGNGLSYSGAAQVTLNKIKD